MLKEDIRTTRVSSEFGQPVIIGSKDQTDRFINLGVFTGPDNNTVGGRVPIG
jgi:hypothetical protein